jgi:hypothetical protein
MTERMSHEEYVAMQRRRVAELARDILAGEVDVLDGSARIVSLRDELDIDRDDDDLMAFVVVDSETDALPVGAEALNWSEDALARKQPELERARSWAFDVVHQPCQNLVARFGDV